MSPEALRDKELQAVENRRAKNAGKSILPGIVHNVWITGFAIPSEADR